MATRLEKLLESIDPERTIDECARRADEAINTFSLQEAKVCSWDEFKDCTTRFLQHTENRVLRISRDHDLHMDLGRVSRLLMKELGPNGDIAAAQMAMTGTDGGLLKVLRIIATRLVQEYNTNEIGARVAKFWNATPMLRSRLFRSWPRAETISLPLIRTWPAIGGTRPIICLRMVLLPHPDPPRMTKISPRKTSKEMSSMMALLLYPA